MTEALARENSPRSGLGGARGKLAWGRGSFAVSVRAVSGSSTRVADRAWYTSSLRGESTLATHWPALTARPGAAQHGTERHSAEGSCGCGVQRRGWRDGSAPMVQQATRRRRRSCAPRLESTGNSCPAEREITTPTRTPTRTSSLRKQAAGGVTPTSEMVLRRAGVPHPGRTGGNPRSRAARSTPPPGPCTPLLTPALRRATPRRTLRVPRRRRRLPQGGGRQGPARPCDCKGGGAEVVMSWAGVHASLSLVRSA